MNNLSYKDILKDFRRFKQSGGYNGDEASTFDIPNHSFFRILWHFNGSGQGLLHPTWLTQTDPTYEDLWEVSSAYNYLLLNDEKTRATYLKTFIELLSTITTDSPWYFQTIKGIEEGLQRKETDEMQWKEPYTITIECMEDSLDQRIGTLIDLYRSVAWSWERRVEILPVNLRRFDMSVLVFSSPIKGLHILNKPSISDAMGAVSKWLHVDSRDYASFSGVGYKTSYKRYDLLNCEFDYKTISTPGEGFNNMEGTTHKYTITIKCTDIRESRHNEFSGMYINDVTGEDMIAFGNFDNAEFGGDSDYDYDKEVTKDNISKITYNPTYEKRVGPKDRSVINQLWGLGTGYVSSKVNELALGNMFGLSLTKIGDQVGSLLNFDIGKTYTNIQSYLNKPDTGKRNSSNMGYLSGFKPGTSTLRDR